MVRASRGFALIAAYLAVSGPAHSQATCCCKTLPCWLCYASALRRMSPSKPAFVIYHALSARQLLSIASFAEP